MANYWDTFKPGLLAGEDYWEDFTPEAPTQTGVVGAVTRNRFQPWEKGYHNIAGLVDDSGQYDAWYDPDPPPVTSVPSWGTPEGYENWKTRIGLETGNGNGNGTGSSGAEGGEGSPDQESWTEDLGVHDSFGGTPWQDAPGLSGLGKKLGWNEVTSGVGNWATDSPLSPDYKSSGPFSSLSDILGTVDISKALLGGLMSGPLGAIFGGLGGISGIKSLLDGTHPALQGTETQSQAEAQANVDAMSGGADVEYGGGKEMM